MSISIELKKAVLNSMTGKYLVYGIQLISLTTLARLFTPEQFGLVVIAQVFIMFFQMMATSGMAPAIVYQKEISTRLRDGIFSFSVLLGAFLTIFFVIIAPYIHKWFGFNQGLMVFYALAICVFFSSISMVPIASLQRDTLFIKIAYAEIFAELMSLFACFVAYFYKFGLYALALKYLLVPVFRFIFYYLFSSSSSIGRPHLGTDIWSVKKILGFAKHQIAFNVLNYFSRNLDNILIAKFFGVASLGVYDKTYQIMRYPLQLFSFAITPALMPILTKYQSQPEMVCTEYYKVSFRLALIGLFSSFVLFWAAEDVIYILFGDQWYGAVNLLKILSLSIPVQMVLSSTGGVYQAFGATRSMLFCGVFSSIVTVCAIITGVFYGDLILLCIGLWIGFSINYVQCFIVLHRTVFSGFGVRYAIALTFLVMSTSVNFLFFEKNFTEPDGIKDAVYNILVVAAPSAFIIGLLYVMTIKNSKLSI